MEELKPEALALRQKYAVPASAIVGMAIVESGYGFTRIGYHANNLFGIKKWGKDNNSYQLVGQPDEDDGHAKILERLPGNQLIFEEASRKDNRYRIFKDKAESLRFLVEEIVVKNSRYRPALENYNKHVNEGMSAKEASRVFLKELADAGYCHRGGDYYRRKIGTVIDQKNLDELDK